jgi:hypothetical protein
VFDMLCYGKGWRAEVRQRYPTEAAMRAAAAVARSSGRFSYAEFFVHTLVPDRKGPPYWVRHKLESEGPMQGWVAPLTTAAIVAQGQVGSRRPGASR